MTQETVLSAGERDQSFFSLWRQRTLRENKGQQSDGTPCLAFLVQLGNNLRKQPQMADLQSQLRENPVLIVRLESLKNLDGLSEWERSLLEGMGRVEPQPGKVTLTSIVLSVEFYVQKLKGKESGGDTSKCFSLIRWVHCPSDWLVLAVEAGGWSQPLLSLVCCLTLWWDCLPLCLFLFILCSHGGCNVWIGCSMVFKGWYFYL